VSNARAKSINEKLYRPLKDGKEYDALMPFSDCSSLKLAEGDTKVAIENMAYWSKEYRHHTSRLAETFTNKGLKSTCDAVHQFLYWHFQYKIDGIKQNLCSPACAWFKRKDGIDCKSFSIIGSTILENLGIYHYFRRVKTAPNEGYSHVYVIVPINQKQPQKLSDGYYVIDGTLPYTQEPISYKQDDVFMDVKEASLPIYGLAGISSENKQNTFLGNPVKDALLNGVATFINLGIQGLLNELMGCDDADYEFPVVKLRVERDLKAPLLKKIADLDDAIKWGNRRRIQHLFNEIFKNFDLGIAHLRNETAYSQRDECIAQTLAITLKYIEKLKEGLDSFYTNFTQSFARYKIDEFSKTSTTTDRTMYFVVGQSENPINAEYRFIVIRQEESKYGIDPILPFGKEGETFEFTSNKWLLENIQHLKNNYKDGREANYKAEVLPLIEKVGNLRKDAHLGGETLYLFEQPTQREMYKVWLKYDTNYTDYLKEEAQSLRTANELAMRDYQDRLTKEIEKDKSVKKRKALKKNLAIGAVAFTGFLVVKNK